MRPHSLRQEPEALWGDDEGGAIESRRPAEDGGRLRSNLNRTSRVSTQSRSSESINRMLPGLLRQRAASRSKWSAFAVADDGAWLKTPSARRNSRRPIDHHSPRRLRPALHFYPDRKSNNRRPGSGAPGRWGSVEDSRRPDSSRRTGEPGRTSDDARPLDRSTKPSPSQGSGRRSSIGRERTPGQRPTLRGSQSNSSCRFPRYAWSNLTPTEESPPINNRAQP